MNPMIGAGLITAGANILGGIIGSQNSAQNNEQMQLRQLAWEREKLKKEQDYNTMMSNSAHQREIADLKAAGLNPVLSAGGQGAATIPAQGGSIGAIPDSSGQILANSINSAMGQFVEGAKIQSEINLMKSQSFAQDMEGIKALAESKVANKKILETTANTALINAKTDLINEQWNKATHESMLAYYQVQQAAEELNYIKQNAKNKSEILAAENRLKAAEANMKEKQDYLYYFGFAWDKGMDIAKLATNIFGIGKINSAINAAKNLPGMKR